MTCIVGFERDGDVYVGADSAEVDNESMSTSARSDRKVFIDSSRRFVIGFSGSWRVGQLLQHAVRVPVHRPPKDDTAFMVTNFVDSVRAAQKKRGSLKRQDDVEGSDSDLLVGYRGRLYVVRSDFAVARMTMPFAAVGSGEQVALGAMHAIRCFEMSPERRIVLALEAAAEYCAGVRPPFHVIKLGQGTK